MSTVAARALPGGAVFGLVLDLLDGPTRENSGLVYVLRANDAETIKVGHVCDQNRLLRRIAEIQTGASEPLELVAALGGGTRLERALHRDMSVSRLSGEWFTDQGRHYTHQIQQHMNSEGWNLIASWAGVRSARRALREAETCLKVDLQEFV